MTTIPDILKVLEPFARLGELIELETIGFDNDDQLPLTTEDGHLLDRFEVQAFRAARALHEALSALPTNREAVAREVLAAEIEAEGIADSHRIRREAKWRGEEGHTLRLERAAQGEAFQARALPWLLACFGEEIARDREERNHRFLEESLELVQACGCTASEAHQLVDYVYGRPLGEPAQEVGGVMVTLAALCLANDLDMHGAAETELARIWTKVEAIRAKQAAKPKHSPLPQHVETTATQAGEITQGDRDAAADLAKRLLGDRMTMRAESDIRHGRSDDFFAVQIVAHHRRQSVAEAVEGYKSDLLTIAAQFYAPGTPEARGIITAIEHATAIRGDHHAEGGAD